MRLGIMQPYFFPYLGYVSLIKHVDKFILLDDVQFIRHGWIERNRILKPLEGWQYVKVPLQKHSRETKIKKISINSFLPWKNLIISQLQHYEWKANHFYEIISLLEVVFNDEYESITNLNKFALEKVCQYLGIQTKIEVFSEMDLNIEPIITPDDWALNICKAMNANEYWNPPGGQSLFDREKYHRNQVHVNFLKSNLPSYDQKRSIFEPGLSILDVIMFNDVDSINQMLDDFELL